MIFDQDDMDDLFDAKIYRSTHVYITGVLTYTIHSRLYHYKPAQIVTEARVAEDLRVLERLPDAAI